MMLVVENPPSRRKTKRKKATRRKATRRKPTRRKATTKRKTTTAKRSRRKTTKKRGTTVARKKTTRRRRRSGGSRGRGGFLSKSTLMAAGQTAGGLIATEFITAKVAQKVNLSSPATRIAAKVAIAVVGGTVISKVLKNRSMGTAFTVGGMTSAAIELARMARGAGTKGLYGSIDDDMLFDVELDGLYGSFDAEAIESLSGEDEEFLLGVGATITDQEFAEADLISFN